jgi:iron complex outermembrane receptor protein
LAIQLANQAAAGTLPAGVTLDDGYYDAAGLRRDYLGGATLNANLAPGVNIKTTGYYHDNKGQGSWITPYNPTPLGAANADGAQITNPAPLSFRTTEYGLQRGGVISAATFETGANTFGLGGWYEASTLDIARRLYGMTAGTPNRDATEYQNNPYSTAWDGNYDTQTLQYHVEDTLKLAGDVVVLSAGWKGVRVVNNAKLRVGALAQGRIEAKDWFQPQASILVLATDQVELFADYTENMRAFIGSAAGGPFATSQPLFDAVRDTIEPETSKTIEGGVRFRAGGFQTSAVGYFINFDNRLLSVANGVGILGNSPTLNNVGSVHTYGGEFSVNYRIVQPLSIFASYSYNHSEYQDDIATNAGIIRTAGKLAVDSPEHMLKGEVVYNDEGVTARIGADYMSKRYFTYLNDQSVPARVLVDASLGYRFEGEGALHGFSIVGNVTNLTNKKYISTIGSNGFTNSGDNQTLLAGAPRQVFITLRKGF